MISLSTGGILKWVACRKIDRTEGPNDYQNSSLSSDSLKIFRVIASGPRCEFSAKLAGKGGPGLSRFRQAKTPSRTAASGAIAVINAKKHSKINGITGELYC